MNPVAQVETGFQIAMLTDNSSVLSRHVRDVRFDSTDIIQFQHEVVAVVDKASLRDTVILQDSQTIAVVGIRGDVARWMLDLNQPVFTVPRIRRDVARRFFDRELIAIVVIGVRRRPRHIPTGQQPVAVVIGKRRDVALDVTVFATSSTRSRDTYEFVHRSRYPPKFLRRIRFKSFFL